MFQVFRKNAPSTDEKLQVLVNRLKTSTYEEDKVESLNKIFEEIEANSLKVCNIGLFQIIESMKTMENIKPHINIFKKLIELSQGDEIISLMTKSENICIFKSISIKDFANILEILNSKKFYRILASDNDIFKMITSFYKNEYHDLVINFIKFEPNLKNVMIFEGFMDILVNDLYKTDKNYKIIRVFLENSNEAQNYFIKSGLLKAFKKPQIEDFNVFDLVLNQLNPNFHFALQTTI